MSEAELAEWVTYYRLEPWGPERADLNAGIIASTLANCHRDPRRRPEAFTPSDFMPKYGIEATDPETRDGMDPDQVMSVMEGLLQHQDRRQKAGLL